ncbi:shikimate dehydrogenase [Hahella sp. HN01]|uniref:shikimate dehydrogenase n=1 Tax=Hahella sp. HN01 TaxID=2847262 RepID=UPI001C1EF6BB|nr:shikimate dehydrogenase [Hahella sp. HN01]MBU6950208.1 shikimate dehydrogenase [Hahella sp. HN01]
MDMYAVVGNPVSHSKSPKIHGMFAQQTGESLEYTAIQAPLDSFRETVEAFFIGGGKGLNVTVPFKEQAWKIVSERSHRAELAGAVNTLLQRDGRLFGDNTDGEGLVRDICINQGVALSGKKILLVGAGGAVKGVMAPLLDEGPASIVVANRTVSKAEDLARIFGRNGSVSACAFEDLQGPFDVVINGTSASLVGDIPPLPDAVIASHTFTYDMMYSLRDTAFVAWAKARGAGQCCDGLGMLVEQAAAAFYLWRGVRPDTAPVLAALRKGD